MSLALLIPGVGMGGGTGATLSAVLSATAGTTTVALGTAVVGGTGPYSITFQRHQVAPGPGWDDIHGPSVDTTYTDTGRAPSTSYAYRATVHDSVGGIAFSNTVIITTLSQAPTIFLTGNAQRSAISTGCAQRSARLVGTAEVSG